MNTIKAIETRYANYRFRSRLEARWAVFFDALGWEWEYEPEGYETDAGWYLPDFRIDNGFVEIKATAPTENEKMKAKLLANGLNTFVVFGIGLPDPFKIAKGLDGFWPLAQWRDGDNPSPTDCFEDLLSLSHYCLRKWGRGGVFMYADPDPEDVRASEKARSARFEHGERP